MESGQSQSEPWHRLQAVKTTLTRAELLVVIELIGRARRGTDSTTVSTNDLARILNLHPRNIERVISQLLGRGYLTVAERGGGRNRPNVYRITLPETPAQSPVKAAGRGGAGAGESVSSSATRARRNPGAGATKTPATAPPIKAKPARPEILSVRLPERTKRPPGKGALVVNLPATLRRPSST